MSLDLILPVPELTPTEITFLKELYRANPVLEKHIKIMALNDAKELIALSGRGLSAEELILAHEHVRGKLAVLSTFLVFIEDLKHEEQDK